MPDDSPAFAVPQDAVIRRLFRWSGIFPLGAFVIVHVVTNVLAVRGGDAILATAQRLARTPALAAIEAAFVFLPLIVHAAIGAWLIVREPIAAPSPYPRAVRTALRATGVGTAVFVAIHLPELRSRVPGAHPGGGELQTVLGSDLSSTWHGVPIVGVFYLAGAGCVAFHFAAGLWGESRRARLRSWAAWSAGVVGVAIWCAFADVVVLHATGSTLFGGWSADAPAAVAPAEPCPQGPKKTSTNE